MPPALTDLLDVAVDAAVAAGRLTLAYFNNGVEVDRKADSTPVTIADRDAERLIRSAIQRHFPAHAILGEEHGQTPGDPNYRWIIDPIDGTKSFIHGVPMYGVLIGVEVKGRAEVGVVYLPATDELIAAATGHGCTWNGRRAKVRPTASLAEATLLCTSPSSAVKRSDAYERLAAATRLQRGWGDCYGHVLVATGRADIMLDPAMNPWDAAPLLPILTEAGGRYTDWQGNPTIHGKDALATNGILHDAVLAITRSERRVGGI